MRSWHFDSQAIESGDTTTYDRAYGSAEEREERKMLVGNGIYANPATNMQVVADNGMTVKVKPGACWIEGAFGVVDNDESKTLTASENGRIDLIVARFDLSLSARDIHIDVIQGTEGSTSPPGITRSNSVYDIQLAKINVRAGAASILQSDIIDTRYDSAVCGIVTGILDQIDTTNLFAQYQDTFDDFMADLETALSGDVAGNLLSLINTHATNEVIHTNQDDKSKWNNHVDDNSIHVTTTNKINWNSKAAGTHTHSASKITSGTLPVKRGGTGQTQLWTSITFTKSNSKFGSFWGSVQYYRYLDMVYFNMGISVTSGVASGSATVGTVSTTYKPAVRTQLASSLSQGHAYIDTDGKLKLYSAISLDSGTTVYFTGWYYAGD